MSNETEPEATAGPTETKPTQMTAIGMTVGTSLGIAFGAAFDNVSAGLIWGMTIGLALGAIVEARSRID